MGKERRKLSRISRRARIHFKTEKISGQGTVVNLSESGLFIRTSRLVPVGSQIMIPVRLADNRVVDLEGHVAWSYELAEGGDFFGESAGMGIELSAAPEEYLRFIAKMRTQLEVAPRGVEERFEIFHRVRFQSGQEFLMEYTQNLSRGGMYLATKQPLEPGSEIRAQLEIPGIQESLHVVGKVAYRLDPKKAKEVGRTAGYGIQFINLDSETKAKLHHYIHRLEIHRAHPERRQVGTLPRQGMLTEYLVPEILLSLLEQQATGTLLLKRADIHKLVYMRNGHPFFVESSLPSERLGPFLVKKGKIAPADLAQSLEELAESDIHHGEIMVAGGMLDAPVLAAILVEHQEEKLLGTFPWFEGTFEFTPGTDWPRGILMVPLNTYQIVFSGIAQWYDATLISSWMGLDNSSALRRVKMPPPDAVVPPHIFRILHVVSTPQSIGKLTASLQMSREKVISAAYSLIIAGWAVLDFTAQPDVSQPEFRAAPKPPTPANQEVLELLRKWVAEDFERLRRLDFYELLGLDENAADTALTTAYEKCSSRYSSSEAKQIQDEEIKTKIVQIRSWFKLAYDTLKDPNLREYAKGRRLGRAAP
ncbi:MAG TPA: TIGR02266 family protein [Bdellovibrionota bacterium]|nr:TIGR02266 family protein [Bdellovibrionota bacterium]